MRKRKYMYVFSQKTYRKRKKVVEIQKIQVNIGKDIF